MEITTIELPIYYTDIIFIIDHDWTAASKKLKLDLSQDDLKAHALTLDNSDNYITEYEIYLLLKPGFLDINTLMHEVMHIVMYICMFKGIHPDPANDEPLAYLQGYIAEELFKFREKYFQKQLQQTIKELPL